MAARIAMIAMTTRSSIRVNIDFFIFPLPYLVELETFEEIIAYGLTPVQWS